MIPFILQDYMIPLMLWSAEYEASWREALILQMMMVEKNITHTQAKHIVEITTNVGEIVDDDPDIGELDPLGIL